LTRPSAADSFGAVLELIGRTALVTGASRGIGRETALLLARLGARVAVGYARDAAAAKATCAAIEAKGGSAVPLAADLAKDGAAERLVARAEKALGPLDVLVANHGIWKRAPIESMTLAQWDEMLHTNLGSVRELCTAAARGIRVNCVAPGWVMTDMSRDALESADGAAVRRTIPLGRPARADEIAGPIAFLASDLASYLHGEVLSVNGGAVMSG
jgi:3-oxoacyl-[acyl-carrier protein] reductase